MTDENKSEPGGAQGNASTGGGAEKESGDPGRTPGKAEGDEETVDESLSQKEA
ncbi:MAG TPA: hypothetical protein VGO96_12830 [Pyrinomonadaceae bacterium]|jgi:hypothetical protein|nr:hypothetical protein [Pyrinomonadaceae bacterium]